MYTGFFIYRLYLVRELAICLQYVAAISLNANVM